MLILNGGGLDTLYQVRNKYPHYASNLGRLGRPRHASRIRETMDAGFPTAFDNDAFSDWNLALFVKMIGRIEEALWGRTLSITERTAPTMTHFVHSGNENGNGNGLGSGAWHPNLLFVTVPDVPFDALGTARRFCEWAPLLSHLPLAFCVQDGAEKVGIPWDWPNLHALFMAGSTTYKLSQEMADICREGKRRGLHIHGGRVNTLNRIRHMIRLECVDSIDGSGFDRWRDTYIGGGLEFVNHELLDAAVQGDPAVIE